EGGRGAGGGCERGGGGGQGGGVFYDGGFAPSRAARGQRTGAARVGAPRGRRGGLPAPSCGCRETCGPLPNGRERRRGRGTTTPLLTGFSPVNSSMLFRRRANYAALPLCLA